MSALNAVEQVLRSSSRVNAIAAGRIYAIQLPQDVKLPALVLHMVDDRDGRHLLGSNFYPVGRFIVDCLGKDYRDADDLGESVRAALIDYRGNVTGYRIDDIGHDDLDHFDKGETGEIVRRRIGFAMRYRVLEPVVDPDESPPSGP